MDDDEISDTIERLNLVLQSTPKGQPVFMGRALFIACTGQGLVSMDNQPEGANPLYRGEHPIVLPPELPGWEFQIRPHHA